MNKTVPCELTITRTQGDGGDRIAVRLVDNQSRVAVFRGEMSLEDFAGCITGRAHSPLMCEFSDRLNVIGKRKVVEGRSAKLPKTLSRERYEAFIQMNCQEEGWIVDSDLRLQRSITSNGDGSDTAHYSVYKYVDADDPTPAQIGSNHE